MELKRIINGQNSRHWSHAADRTAILHSSPEPSKILGPTQVIKGESRQSIYTWKEKE